MTRKDFIVLAAAIRAAYNVAHTRQEKYAVAFTAGKIADVCSESNPRFNYSRFLAACGISGVAAVAAVDDYAENLNDGAPAAKLPPLPRPDRQPANT